MLRFGIMAMQPQWLMRQALAATEAPQTAAPRMDLASLVGSLVEAGFPIVEINPDLNVLFPGALDAQAVEKLAALRDSHGIRYTVHLPLWSLEPSTTVEPVRRASVAVLAEALALTHPLAPEVYVLHATGALAAEFSRLPVPPGIRAALMRLFDVQARRSVQELLESTRVPSRRLAVETVEFPLDLTLDLAESFDLSMCLDTGHVLAGFCGPVTLEESLERVLPRLAEVHLHDGYRRQSADSRPLVADHLPLGEGDLPVKHVLGRLQAAGFAGPIIMELGLEQARQSLEAIRRLKPGTD